MTKSKFMTFDDFKERVSTEEGMSKMDALIAQKILGKKIEAKGNKYYRVEPPCDKYPKGGTFAIKITRAVAVFRFC